MGVIANVQGIVIVNRSLVIRVWHKWSEHTRVGFLDSTRLYTYTQYLHTRVFLHDGVASYLPFSLSYNATVLVTLFFPYRALAAHQGVEDKIRGGSGINKPNTVASYVLAT